MYYGASIQVQYYSIEIRLFAKERSPERAVEPDNYNTLQHGTFINIQTSAVEA